MNRIKYSMGNMKIGNDTMIINMGSAKDCPSLKRGLCQLDNPLKECYAMKAERMYPSVLPYRQDQEFIWRNSSADDIATQIWSIQSRKRIKFKYLRLNESGDFWSQKCVDKASKLADLLKPIGIKVYCYTARKDLNLDNLSDNLTVTGSGFMAHNNFKSVDDISGKRIVCRMDCRTCHICKESRGVTVYVKKH